MTYTVAQLAALLSNVGEVDIVGSADQIVVSAKPVAKAGPQDLTFVSDQANLKKLSHSAAGATVISRSLFQPDDAKKSPLAAFIVVDDAKRAFTQLLPHLFPPRSRPDVGISPAAHVDPTARIGVQTNVFPTAYIGPDAVIGDRCDIFPGAYIGAGCRIGDEVWIGPNAVLYPDIVIGNRVVIDGAAVVGAEGFGFLTVDGRHQRIPHVGSVRIEDDAELGACCTVDRAMFGETVVGMGSKIDNLVLIAHNCEVGQHNILVGQVGFAGSVTTGSYVVCAGQVGIADHVHLGDGCVLGSKTGINKDVPAGQTYLGVPGQPADEAIRAAMSIKKLPELRKQLKSLQAQVDRLTRQMAELGDSSADQKSAA